MKIAIAQSELAGVYEKVVAGERVDEAEAQRLFATNDLNALGVIAAAANRR